MPSLAETAGAIEADATAGQFKGPTEWKLNSPHAQALAAPEWRLNTADPRDPRVAQSQEPSLNPIKFFKPAASLAEIPSHDATLGRDNLRPAPYSARPRTDAHLAELMATLADRTSDSNLFASRAQVRLEKATSHAEAAAALQGRNVKYAVDPEVSAFFTLLSGDNAKSLKALTDALVSPKLTEHTGSGKFTLAMSRSFTEKQRTAMYEALKLGGSAEALDTKLKPLELVPFSGA